MAPQSDMFWGHKNKMIINAAHLCKAKTDSPAKEALK